MPCDARKAAAVLCDAWGIGVAETAEPHGLTAAQPCDAWEIGASGIVIGGFPRTGLKTATLLPRRPGLGSVPDTDLGKRYRLSSDAGLYGVRA